MTKRTSQKVWAALLYMLPAIGLPVAFAVYIGPEAIRRFPWAALGLLVAAEVILALERFKAGVGAELHVRCAEALANRTEGVVERLAPGLKGLFTSDRRQYLRHLRTEGRGATVQGLALRGAPAPSLERVFVAPNLVLSLAGQESLRSVPELPEDWQPSAHTIWDWLQAKPLQDTNLAIIGSPGSGKTALLKHVALSLATGRRRGRRIQAPIKVPVLLCLRDCAAALSQAASSATGPQWGSSPVGELEQGLSLLQAIQGSLTKAQGPQISEHWFETQLRRGRCLVMLDGLGQVADPTARKQVVRWVEHQMLVYPKTRFVITSRPFAYRSNRIGGDVALLSVEPLDRDQVERFVRNWYCASKGVSQRRQDLEEAEAAEVWAEDLLTRIWDRPALARLAANPLLLTMVVTLHRCQRPLPDRREELYAEICRVILGKGQAGHGNETLTSTQAQAALQSLAYHMMCQRQCEISEAQVVEVIGRIWANVVPPALPAALLMEAKDGSGLLRERKPGLYGFAHGTFQEYLAAVHVSERGLEADLVPRVGDPVWVEVIRMYAAQADASEIILACLAEDPPAVPALDLAIDCMQETPGIRREARERLELALDKGVRDDDPERRQLVAEALLDRRLQGLVQLEDDRYADNHLITHVEYQLFLDDQRAKGRYHQPDHWAGTQFPKGWGKMPVVGVRFADAQAFCEWLTRRSGSRWRYRLLEANELARDITASYKSLPAAMGYWTSLAGRGQYVGSGTQGPTIGRADLVRWVSRDLRIAHDLILDHGRDWNVVRDLDLAYVLDLDPGPARDLHLDLDLTRVVARDRRRRRALVHDLSRDLDTDLDRGRAQALAISYARDVALDCTHHMDRDLDPIHVRALDSVRDLDQALDLTKDRGLHCDPDPAWKEAMDLVRQSVRLDTLALVIGLDVLLRAHQRSLAGQPGSVGTDAKADEIQRMERQLLDVYIDFCILEDRIEGRRPAVEGIRIVQERVERQGTGK